MKDTNIFYKLFFLFCGIIIIVAWKWAGSILIGEVNTVVAMQSTSLGELWPHLVMILMTGSIIVAPIFTIASIVHDVGIPTIKKPEKKGKHERL